MTTRTRRRVLLVVCSTLLLTIAWSASYAAPNYQDAGNCQSIVSPQRGDGWLNIANRYGVSVAALKAANPQAVRRNDQLWLSDRLCIPGTPVATPTTPATATATVTAAVATEATYYTVRAGDGWFAIAQRLGLPFATLWNANPQLQRPGRTLYIGERILIPGTGATPTTPAAPTVQPPTATATATATRIQPAATATATRTRPAATATATATRVRPAATATPTTIVRTNPTATPSPVARVTRVAVAGLPACPSTLADYTTAVEQVLATDVGKLVRWLQGCQTGGSGKSGARGLDIDGDGARDVVVIVADPASPADTPPGNVLIFHGTADPKAWDLRYVAEASGQIGLLETADVNADRKLDIAWTDTTCGAHTCFTRVQIIAWDAAQDEYVNLIGNNATMATAQVRFADVNAGSGKELIMHGGEIGSAGAGPQRPWTEIWASLDGEPYVLVDRTYDPSPCLYHHVLDANDLMAQGKYTEAAAVYADVVDDVTLETCSSRPNERVELREFAWYRQALALAYAGNKAEAGRTVAALAQTLPQGLYAPVANIWWSAYNANEDAPTACATVEAYARANADVWKILADYGYANPTFSADDVCVLPQR